MIRRFSLVAFLAGLLLGGAPVGAQEVEDGVLGAAEVDTSAYPELELTVSLPAGFASDDQASDASGEPTVPVFVVTEEGAALPVEGEALSSSALDVVLAIDTYRRLIGDIPEFKTYLASAPAIDALELSRDETPARVVEL